MQDTGTNDEGAEADESFAAEPRAQLGEAGDSSADELLAPVDEAGFQGSADAAVTISVQPAEPPLFSWYEQCAVHSTHAL